ncbi:MAG TPA: glycoside hydrolase family 2 TIM barrel-domain containing protein [Pseudolysinimonas sp.]|nr:glycoside hydrolase family 2 TIM barrel-domain containing protein [Pseudolysinimonas sp.]
MIASILTPAPEAGPPEVLDLTGEWQLREAIGETWRWYVAAQPPQGLNNVSLGDDPGTLAEPAPGWTAVQVPGSVIDGLHRAGTLPDPRRGWGSRSSEWTAGRHWVLRRTVELDEHWAGADVVAEFDGIDPGGRVLWDGVEVGRSDGLYRRVRLSLAIEEPGMHTLAVVLDPAPRGVPQVGRTDEVLRHGPRLGYGWDFCPPFPHQGLWRPARLRRGPRIARLDVSTECAGVEGGPGAVSIVAETEAAGSAEVVARLERGDGHAPVEVRGPVIDGSARLRIDLEAVPLWWPNGYGDARLCELTVTVGGHSEHRRIGFRSAVWEQTPGSPADAAAYGLRVNGEPIALAGLNWAPADAQYGSIDRERLAHLLDLARASGARMLRIWGGGLVETEEFWELCDERGLLCWQEFSQSSSGMQSAPSDDAGFLAGLEADARELVPRRRHHPALVLWGGGNELEGPEGPLRTEQSPALSALAAVVAELDPGRGWLPTSPSGPVFHHRLEAEHGAEREAARLEQHDVHGPWEYQGLEAQHTLADRGTFLAHTEFGVEGMANRRLWEHVVPEGWAEPADRSNALHRHLGEWWDNAPQVQQLFGGGLGIDELRRASQWLQASGLATAVEADRRRWPRTSLVLPWQLAESYPNTWGTALVGFDGEPKPALAAVARAFEPERATLRTARTAWGGYPEATAEVWLWSERGRSTGGQLTLSAVDLTGRVLATQAETLTAVGHPEPVARLTLPTPAGPFVWRACWLDADGATIDDELLLQTGDADLGGLRTPARTSLQVTPEAGGWRVRNDGTSAAIGWGPRDVRPGEDPRLLAALGDPRPLLPGAESFIRLVSGEPLGRDLVVDAWNAEPVPLPPLPPRRKDIA